MTPVNLVAPRWAVSGRTHGEVLTAGVSTSGLEIVLLGVPQGFTPAEVEGWLHDLSGVAIETSRTDTRERPIPAALHHALTGLLFSQAELWGRASANPCSAAFVDGATEVLQAKVKALHVLIATVVGTRRRSVNDMGRHALFLSATAIGVVHLLHVRRR